MVETKPILVVQTAFLGDLVLGASLLKNIRKLWPERKIFLVCREGLSSLFLQLELVDEAFEIKKGDGKSYQAILRRFKDRPFYRIFAPHYSLRTGFFVRALAAEKKIGFKRFFSPLCFDESVERDLNLPDALRQLSLLGPDNAEIKKNLKQYSNDHRISEMGPVPSWAQIQCAEKVKVDKPLTATNPVAVIFPGSVWPTKQWTKEGFSQLARELMKKNYSVLLMGGSAEKELTEKIAKAAPGAQSLAGSTSLMQTLAVLKQAQIVISNDSGGQHLASLVNVPTLSIFGPTVLDLGYRPWNPQSEIVQVLGMACRPCGKHGHVRCPLGTHACMKEISATEVLKKTMELLSAAPS